MPSPSSPDVTQAGFSTAGGALANLVDADEATFWKPYPDGFDSYTSPVVVDSGNLYTGSAHPWIQFDFGGPVRIPIFQVKVETRAALGPCWLIASDFPATTVSDCLQGGDVLAGIFTLAQMNSNAALTTYAATQNIRKRFWRLLQMIQPPAA